MNKEFIIVFRSIFLRFLIPLFIGTMFGILATTFSDYKIVEDLLVRVPYTLSENFLVFLEWFTPFIILIYLTTGINKVKDDFKAFLIKFFITVFATLFICGLLTLSLSALILPHIVGELVDQGSAWPKSYFTFSLMQPFDVFTALILGCLLGFYMDRKSQFIAVMTELETFVNKTLRNIIIPFAPIWIIGSFAASSFSSGGWFIIKTELSITLFIFALQFLWTMFMFLCTSLYSKIKFSSLFKAGLKITAVVLSLAGNGTGVIVPIIIEEQVILGINRSKAKFISASSFNLPGSMISNVALMYGTCIMFGVQISVMQFILYVFCLVLLIMAAPAIMGGVFVVTSQALSPILGFTDPMIALMQGLYFRQGTNNACTNNVGDFYLSGLTIDESDIDIYQKN